MNLHPIQDHIGDTDYNAICFVMYEMEFTIPLN